MIEQVRQILKEGEGITVEFKTSRNELNKNAFESICAFLNRKGGHLLLGVADNGTIEGVEETQVQRLMGLLVSLMNNPQKLSPTVYLIPEIIELDGKKIIYLHIPESSQVHSTTGKIFDRNSDGDFNITGNHSLVEQLYLRKANSFTESGIYKFLSVEDFRSDLIARVRKLASVRTPGHLWESMNDEELLRSAKLYRKDFKTGEEGFVLAAALLFGKDEVIQNILPAYKTDALVRIVNTDRYDDRLEVRTNLIESYDLLIDFIRKHLPDPFYLENDQRISLRDKIFREVIANTLVHREFLNSFPSRLVIEKEKVVIENWNKPYIPGIINPGNFYTHPKNPIILEVFKQIGRADELGSGIRNVFKYGKLYGKFEPVFDEGDIFTTVIYIPDKYILNVESGDYRVKGRDASYRKEDDIYHDAVNDAVNDAVKNRLKIELLEIIKNEGLSLPQLMKDLTIKRATAQRDMKILREIGFIHFLGAPKTGKYMVTEKLVQILSKL